MGKRKNVEISNVRTSGENSKDKTNEPSPLIATLEKCECSFCLIELNPGDGIMLRDCLHNYCRECITHAVENSKSSQIVCPLSDESSCGGIVLDAEIKALLSGDAYGKYLDRSIEKAEAELGDLFKCRNPSCSAIHSISPEAKELACTQCTSVSCLKCKELKQGSLCKCRKRTLTCTTDASPSPCKVVKLDAELERSWETTWSQLSASFCPQIPASLQAQMSSRNQSEYSGLVTQIEERDLILSTQEFECSICYCDIPVGEGVILKDCFHLFCRECLASTIELSEDSEVKCPFKINENSCQVPITAREIRALLSKESYEKYMRRSVTQAEMKSGNAFHCKTANCSYWLEVDEGAREKFLICPICNKRNCLKCKAIHEAVSCQEYQAKLDKKNMNVKTRELIEKNIKKGLAMKCPTCKIIIEKSYGCDGMQCSVCKTHICWATKGPRWGPRGPGDRTGGCHCRENGKACHPKCRNCH